jgi:hypothetical protein
LKKIEWTNIETKHHEIEVTTKNSSSTTKFGYVPNGRKRRSQDYRSKDVGNE